MGWKRRDKQAPAPQTGLQRLPGLDREPEGSQHSASATCHSPRGGLPGAPMGCLPTEQGRVCPPHPSLAPAPAPHHLVGLHGQLHLIVAVLLTLAVGALDLLQVLHALVWGQRLHGGDILRGQDVDLCFLI